MSSQVESGVGGGMHMSGYEESQAVSFAFSSSCAVGDGSFSFACFGSWTISACSASTLDYSNSSPAVNSLMLLSLHFLTEQQ